MSMIDSLSKGASFIDQLRKGQMLAEEQRGYGDRLRTEDAQKRELLAQLLTQGKYLDPNLSADLFTKQTNNKYLDEKNRLGNEFQGLENKWYEPKTRAGLASSFASSNHLNEQTKYLPLDMALKTEGAMNRRSKSGDAQQYLKFFGEMPAAQRELYLSMPENYRFHNQMMNQFKEGANHPENNSSLLTPEFLKKFGLAAPMSNQSDAPPQSRPGSVGGINNRSGQRLDAMGGAEETEKTSMINPNQSADKPNLELAYQMRANRKNTTSQMQNRAESAVALDEWFVKNRDEYAPKIANAVYAAGAIGRGKTTLDALKTNQPQRYLDYVWFEESFKPNFVNQVKMMEKMGATDSQREELHGSLAHLNDLKSSPDAKLKQINSAIKTFQQISDSVINSAEPVHKGVYRQAAGTPKIDGDYVSGKYLNDRFKEENNSKNEKVSAGAKSLSKSIELPKFSTKEEFQSWFSMQPSVVQSAVKMKLSGG